MKEQGDQAWTERSVKSGKGSVLTFLRGHGIGEQGERVVVKGIKRGRGGVSRRGGPTGRETEVTIPGG